ncbi:MAG: sodium-translocating pyrophosphatase, partial [Terriglobia bacterium]
MSEASLALSTFRAHAGHRAAVVLLTALVLVFVGGIAPPASAATAGAATSGHAAGGEANLKVPDLGGVSFSGINGRTLLLWGLVVCVLGLLFGLVIFVQMRNLPVHQSMREISELIYETCKTYLITQGKFIL